MSVSDTFEPRRDGWIFTNWGETAPFSWDLYRRTYMGINASQDCVQAPLDCAFYEIFKSCAVGGNCGGISLLALAMFKHGGWMGYCSPARFYTGVNEPDRQDLHETINILQARQFSASGIENFIDLIEAGNLNNAEAAYNTIASHLGSGDYCVLSIANDALGDIAHTIIPYRVDPNPTDHPGAKAIYVWNPNIPYDDNPAYYDDGENRLIIRSATDWAYENYSGTPTGWCYAVPMSKLLRKSRQPMTVDMVGDALMSLFVSGPGAAVAQIEDEDGRRLYTNDGAHLSRGDLETDPTRRLQGIGRWPWHGGVGDVPGELYFMRGRTGRRSLKITVTGDTPRVQLLSAHGLVELQATAGRASRDVIHVGGLATASQGVRLTASKADRRFDLRQLKRVDGPTDWRSVTLSDLRPGPSGVTVHSSANLLDLQVQSAGTPQVLRAHVERFRDATRTQRTVTDLRAARGRPGLFDAR